MDAHFVAGATVVLHPPLLHSIAISDDSEMSALIVDVCAGVHSERKRRVSMNEGEWLSDRRVQCHIRPGCIAFKSFTQTAVLLNRHSTTFFDYQISGHQISDRRTQLLIRFSCGYVYMNISWRIPKQDDA